MNSIEVFVDNLRIGIILEKVETLKKLKKNEPLPNRVLEKIKPMSYLVGKDVKFYFFENFTEENNKFQLYVFSK